MNLFLFALIAPRALAVEPSRSLDQFVSSNGYGVVRYGDDRADGGWSHVYMQHDETAAAEADVLFDSYFGITAWEGGRWLTVPASVEVVDGTQIVASTQIADPLEFTQYTFMPMTLGGWGVAQVLRIVNNSDTATIPPFQAVSLHNWQAGGSEEIVAADPERVTESAGDMMFAYRAPGADSVTCDGVYDQVVAGKRIAGDCDGYGTDGVPAFGWNVRGLGPGEDVWVGVFTTQDVGLVGWIDDRDARQWVLDELAWWSDVHARAPAPAGLDEREARVWRQQVAWLVSGRVREPGDTYGQIPASLTATGPDTEFAHMWNITWVRDSAYAAVGLARAGLVEEAADALRFLLQDGKAGRYATELGTTAYGVSVCRLYGNGDEWSDENEDGPNIELDNWGSFLWALGDVVGRAPDTTLLDELGPRALDTVADPLLTLVQPDGLVLADSSIWERHWNGKQQHFTYTQAQAVAGLRAAADLADRLADPRADGYRTAADALAAAVASQLVDADGVVAQSREALEAGSGYLDVSAAAVFEHDVVDAEVALDPTLAAWDATLGVASGPGFARNDDGDAYDTQEWAWADLEVQRVLRRHCRTARADELFDWVTELADLNERVIPELLDPADATYEGPAPMLGFGAGMWLIAAAEKAADPCPPVVDTGGDDSGGDSGADDTDGPPDTGGKPPDDMSCGCAAARGGAGLSAALLGLLAAWSRGRRAGSRSGRRPR